MNISLSFCGYLTLRERALIAQHVDEKEKLSGKLKEEEDDEADEPNIMEVVATGERKITRMRTQRLAAGYISTSQIALSEESGSSSS